MDINWWVVLVASFWIGAGLTKDSDAIFLALLATVGVWLVWLFSK